jgi:hypothetical protein
MSKIVATCFAIIICLGCATTAQPQLSINLNELASSPEKFVGKRIQTTGCVQIHAHGAHISPCKKHSWKEILLIEDASHFSSSEQFANAGLNIWRSPYAEFSGVIHKSRSKINPAKHVYTLVVDQVRNAAEREP